MPQMSPLLWGILFIVFTVLIIASSIKIFYIYFNSPNSSTPATEITTNKTMNWMW